MDRGVVVASDSPTAFCFLYVENIQFITELKISLLGKICVVESGFGKWGQRGPFFFGCGVF